jgi:hypothetical protein
MYIPTSPAYNPQRFVPTAGGNEENSPINDDSEDEEKKTNQ